MGDLTRAEQISFCERQAFHCSLIDSLTTHVEMFRAIAETLRADREAAPAPPVCPHCQFPAVFPEVCTPELNAAIEANMARDWSLLNAGFTIGQAGVAVAPKEQL